jgi:hypothetical protein
MTERVWRIGGMMPIRKNRITRAKPVPVPFYLSVIPYPVLELNTGTKVYKIIVYSKSIM